MTDQELGANIKRIRDMKGKSQLELSMAIESSQKHLSRIERGLTSPSFSILVKICTALKVDIKTLLNFDEKTVFNNIINNDKLDVKEFVAYNNTDVERIEILYEKLLSIKDGIIADLTSKIEILERK